MKRSLTAALGLLLLCGVSLVGCGGGSSPAPRPPTAEEQQKIDDEMRAIQKDKAAKKSK